MWIRSPVFFWFVNVQHDYTTALRYVEWKYAFGQNTGYFSSYLVPSGAYAFTDAVSGITFYGSSTFKDDDENLLASTIGHEGVHRGQSRSTRLKAKVSKILYNLGIGNGYWWAVAELPAYEWEINNLGRTGLEGYFVLDVYNQYNFFADILWNIAHPGRPKTK